MTLKIKSCIIVHNNTVGSFSSSKMPLSVELLQLKDVILLQLREVILNIRAKPRKSKTGVRKSNEAYLRFNK